MKISSANLGRLKSSSGDKVSGLLEIKYKHNANNDKAPAIQMSPKPKLHQLVGENQLILSNIQVTYFTALSL